MSRLSSAADTPPAAEGGAGDNEVDPLRSEMLATVRQHLGAAVLASDLGGGDLCVRVERSAWANTADVLKNAVGMDYFCFVSGLDWLVNPDLSGEKVWDPDGGTSLEGAEGFDNGETAADEAAAVDEAAAANQAGGGIKTGVAGGDSRFQVFARVFSTTTKVGITVKADLDEANPSIGSWVGVYRGADWHEREAWEMYGFDFVGHPGLRHMYLPGEFEGHPLRKDFPLLAREVKPWPGLVDVEAMPGEETAPDGAGTEGAEA